LQFSRVSCAHTGSPSQSRQANVLRKHAAELLELLLDWHSLIDVIGTKTVIGIVIETRIEIGKKRSRRKRKDEMGSWEKCKEVGR
jgi:hypothetical protein